MNVGDKLWFVPTDRRDKEGPGKELILTKIGREYVYSQDKGMLYKISKKDLRVVDNRGSYEGKCYVSTDAYTLEKLRQSEWKKIHNWMERQWFAPSEVTLNDVLQIQVLLKLRKEEIAPRPPRAERAYGPPQFFHD